MIERVIAPALAAVAIVSAAATVRVRDAGLVARSVGSGVPPGVGRRRMTSLAPLLRALGGGPRAARLPGRMRLARLLAVLPEGPSLEEVLGLKVLASVLGFALPVAAGVPAVAPMLCAAAYLLPDAVLASSVKRRLAAADREVPLLLDLLAAASAAGLSGQLAMRRTVVALQGPLATELSEALANVDLGVRWRDALVSVLERLPLADLRRAVALLTRTDTLGTSLAESLRELAEQARDARRASVSERARAAPVKMLFPLVFLVLPAFLLLTVVPVLLTTVSSIR